MIYATIKPIEEYSVVVEGQRVGIYDSYIDRPAMLALVCLITPFAFDYEGGRESSQCRVRLTPEPEKVFADTLETKIDGTTIAEHLETLNPLEFNDLIQAADVSALPAVSANLGGSQQAFKLIVSARATAWALNYRGRTPSQGKVINIAFRGLAVSSEMRRSYEHLKKELMA